MKKALSYLLTPVFYFFFILVLLVFHPLQWLSFNLLGYNAHKKVVDYLNGGLVACYYLMGTRVQFTNRYNLPENRTILFISNHQSLFDIPALIWFLRDYKPKFVSKIELGKTFPSIGYNLHKSGAALVDRNDPLQALAEIERLGKFIQVNAYSAILFPEGTRSRTGVMKVFTYRGFAKLIECNPTALIVPVAINNAWKIQKYGSFPLSFGEDLSWTILEPLEQTGKTMGEVVKYAEEAIRRELGQ